MEQLSQMQQADEVIVRYADTLSPADIAFKLEGLLTPAQVRARTIQLLESPDWLSAMQQDQLVTMKMRKLIVRLEEMTLTSRTAEILIRALEALGNRLDKRYQANEVDLQRLYAFQGVAFLDAVTTTMKEMQHRLISGVPITAADWDEALTPALSRAQLQLEALENPEASNDEIVTAQVSGNRSAV